MRAIYIPKKIEPLPRPNRIDFGSGKAGSRSIDEALKTLTEVSIHSEYIFYSPLGLYHYGRNPYRLPRYIFLGPAAGDEPIRLGLFAVINGDEPEGVQPLVEFLLRLELEPERGRGYGIFVYPICNPTGFEDGTRLTRRGHDLSRGIWNGSKEPEIYYLERELGVLQFHGIVNLRSVADRNGIHARVQSATLSEALVKPALKAAGKYLLRDNDREDPQIIPTATIVRNRYEGELGNPAEIKSAPFEITFELPRKAPPDLQTSAATAALNKIIEEYRPFLASRQNL